METAKYAGIHAVKSQKRISFVNGLVKVLESRKIYWGMPKSIDEKGFIDSCRIPIEQGLAKLFLKESQSSNKEWAERKARSSLFLERNAKTTVNNTLLFGTQHRPDMLVKHGNDYRIAIEFKVAHSGDEVRAALGQCLVYASEYEFTIALVLDATSTGKIKRAYDKGELESQLIEKLWEDFGIRVVIVRR